MPATTRLERARRGFALIAVLSVMVGAVALGITLSTATNEALGAARNRISLTRATWFAEGCIERARAVVGDALLDERRASMAWNDLDSVVAASMSFAGCDVRLVPAGTRLDVNSASENALHILFQAIGVPVERVDSLVDALLDWRDTDDETRPRGAERGWYEKQRRPGPRNGALASPQELRLVRGLGDVAGVDTMLGVEGERIWIDRAPLAVISTLPGMTVEAMGRIRQLREAGSRIGNLAALADGLSPSGREALLSHYAELVARTTLVPDAWTLTARAASGSPEVVAAVELRLVRAGSRAAIVRRRSWP
jgi:Tfp pilus assembly protein PilX